MGVWDGIAVETTTHIVSRATEGAHAPSCPGASRVARPHKLIHLKRALRRPRPSSWRLSISTFSDLSDPPGCMRMRGRGEKRERSPGCLSPLAHTARRVDESAKMACGVALSRVCHFLMFGRCYLSYMYGERSAAKDRLRYVKTVRFMRL